MNLTSIEAEKGYAPAHAPHTRVFCLNRGSPRRMLTSIEAENPLAERVARIGEGLEVVGGGEGGKRRSEPDDFAWR